jgi:hypothetical protein
MREPDAAVKLWLTRQPLIHAGRANQKDAKASAVEYVSDFVFAPDCARLSKTDRSE